MHKFAHNQINTCDLQSKIKMPDIKKVVAAITVKNNEVLLAKRAQKQRLEGFWEFPGGKLEKGESIAECIEREIEEELGIQIKAQSEFFRNTYKYDHVEIELISVLVELFSDDFKLSVHDEIKWIPFNELQTYKIAPADIPIVKKLIKDFES